MPSRTTSPQKSRKQDREKRELQELSLLLEISTLLDSSMDLQEVVGPVLNCLARQMGMHRGTIALVNRQSGEIVISAAHGLSASQRERGRYRPGEGIIGKVIQSGQPVIVPRVSEEPLFLNRTGARNVRKDKIAFVSVPIKVGNQTMGALSVDRLLPEDVKLKEDVRILKIIASMIAQAVRLRRKAEEERERLVNENKRLQHELEERFKPSNIIGNSKQMRDVYDQIAQVCRSNTTALIRGESGTGKELVAHAIHYNSPRSSKPFIRVNCAALPETLVESELFGHEKGAFTGALSMRRGRFEQANGGTIFLDEVGDFSPATQVKLLRVLQEREFERVGGNTALKVDVRIIAATNRNLEEMIADGTFRQDLYYRLNVFSIHLPALRERKADILLLADFFASRYGGESGKSIKRISTPAIDMLMSYHWPGNVRELENCIERAVLVSGDGVIHGNHLPPTLQTAEASGTGSARTLDEALADLERERIIEALKSTRGNKAKAARLLGLTERLMGLRVARHEIDPRRFKGNW